MFHDCRAPQRGLLLILLDASASTLRGGALARAKGIAHAALAQAYHGRWQAAILLCQGPVPRLVQRPQRPPKDPTPWLLPIHGHGGTPLTAALRQAARLLEHHARRHPTAPRRLLILTDGRSPRPALDLRLPAVVDYREMSPPAAGLARGGESR